MNVRTAQQHCFTVDVEDWFQVSAFERIVDAARWESLPSRVERNTDRLLALLDGHGTLGTFFTVGWVAERFPGLVRRIAAAGHEVASHSYWHRRVLTLAPGEFRDDLRRSRDLLSELAGAPVIGFRAPTFSIVRGTEWALDVLVEEGFRYDSSLFPIRRPGYGYAGAEPTPHLIRRPAGTLLEVPPTTLAWLGLRLPAAGGGYFRQLPYGLTALALRQGEASGHGGMFYVHPWEIDPDQPRLDVSWLTRRRHYRRLDRTYALLERLLRDFRFTSVARRFAPVLSAPDGVLSADALAPALPVVTA